MGTEHKISNLPDSPNGAQSAGLAEIPISIRCENMRGTGRMEEVGHHYSEEEEMECGAKAYYICAACTLSLCIDCAHEVECQSNEKQLVSHDLCDLPEVA